MKGLKGLVWKGLDKEPAYQWDTKRKLFSLAEVCTPPSAITVKNRLGAFFVYNAHREIARKLGLNLSAERS